MLSHGILGQVYYGKKINVKPQYPELLQREMKTDTPAYSLDEPTFQIGDLKQEYSDTTGDFRRPAYQVLQANGSRITDFGMIIMKLFGLKGIVNGNAINL